jgi:uncharacterized protein (DUF58 family)
VTLVPRNRLLFWFALLVPSFSFLAAVEPRAFALSLLILAAFVAVVLLDCIISRLTLTGVSVELPAILRMSIHREAKVELRISNPLQKPTNLRLALSLPPEIQSPEDAANISLPAKSEWSRFFWSCRPWKRGNYRLQSVHLESNSRFGFWSNRKLIPARSEIRVYPNLLADRRDLAALFLHRGSFGLHAQRQVGKGREFEKLREYVPGDGYDELHWKATARRGRPITKVFQIERTQEVYVVIDASRLSARQVGARPTSGTATSEPRFPQNGFLASSAEVESIQETQPFSILERFITAALILGLAAEQHGDLFGLLAFANQVDRFVRAKNGKAHYSACRDALYSLQPQIVAPDFDEVCTFIRLRLRRRALILFLTALDDAVLAESFIRNMDLIRRQHLILVNMLQPPGVEPLFANPNVSTVDSLYQHLGGHFQWQSSKELETVLRRRGIRFSLLKNERFAADLVSQYLDVKRRQTL